MIALVLGVAFILFAVYAVLPAQTGLGWWRDVLIVLRGAIPLLAFFIGLIALFIGIADMKDRAEARKEEDRNRTE